MAQNFTVPQFIDIEDKLVGPLSFRQFVYILGGAGGAFLLWRLLPGFIAIPLMLPIIALAVSLAFVKIHSRPFIIIFISAVKYYISGKIYLWKKGKNAPQASTQARPENQTMIMPKSVSGKKLSDIAWSLDVHENIR